MSSRGSSHARRSMPAAAGRQFVQPFCSACVVQPAGWCAAATAVTTALPPAPSQPTQARATLLCHRAALHDSHLRSHGAVPPPPSCTGGGGSSRQRSGHSSRGSKRAAVSLGPAAACLTAAAAARQAYPACKGGAPSRCGRQRLEGAANRSRCGCPSAAGRQQPQPLAAGATTGPGCCCSRCTQRATTR